MDVGDRIWKRLKLAAAQARAHSGVPEEPEVLVRRLLSSEMRRPPKELIDFYTAEWRAMTAPDETGEPIP